MENANTPGTMFVGGYRSRYNDGNLGMTLTYVGRSAMVLELLHNSTDSAKWRMNIREYRVAPFAFD